jgi:hypothetical protein
MKKALTVTTVAATMVLSLAGCGPKSASHGSSSSSSGKSGSCSTGYVSGKINGQAKCLQQGQQCQQSEASSYKSYGFTCTKTNGRYELQKK